jgi:hypothetical protein
MSPEYEIHAEPAGSGPGPHTLATAFRLIRLDTGAEVWAIASITRETLHSWGFGWPASERHPGREAVRLLSQVALDAILKSLTQGDEIPRNIEISTDFYGGARPFLSKECTFREAHDAELHCVAAAGDDPWSGITTELLCLGCEMPHRDMVCNHLKKVETSWFPEGGEQGVRRVVKAECTGGGDPRDTAECVPGLKNCWVRRIGVP